MEGYTDSAGDEAYNFKLSEARAQTVADYIKAGYPELANVIELSVMEKTILFWTEKAKKTLQHPGV